MTIDRELSEPLEAAAADAIRRDERFRTALHDVLAENGQPALPAIVDRIAAVIGELMPAILAEAAERTRPIGALRHLLLDNSDRTYNVDDLARIWQITRDEVLDVCHDEMLAVDSESAASAPALSSADAVRMSINFNLIRWMDIEEALGEDFAQVWSESWRTVPLLLRFPRFVLGKFADAPSFTRRTLTAQLEHFVLERFLAEHPTESFDCGWTARRM